MTTKNNVVEAEEKLEEAPAQPTEPQQKSMDLNDTVAAYVVALNKDGNFVFQTFGERPGVLEISGLQNYAARRIGDMVDKREGRGTAVTMEVGRMVVELTQRVTTLLNKIDPPKPDNEL